MPDLVTIASYSVLCLFKVWAYCEEVDSWPRLCELFVASSFVLCSVRR